MNGQNSMDSREYLKILKQEAQSGREVSMIISGNSMQPFLEHGRDVIYFTAPRRKLKRGDMVFFTRPDGSFVMHRIISIRDGKFKAIGDNQDTCEGPFDTESIFALVTKVKRKDRMIGPSSFVWLFFRFIWLNIIPLRQFLIKSYRSLSRLWK